MLVKAKIIDIILFILVILLFFIGHNLFLCRGIFDEGLAIYGAERVLNGDIPYRDFWTLYSPGIFYLLAICFKIFGVSVIVERMAGVVTHFLFLIVSYFILKPLVSKRYVFLGLFLISLFLRRLLFYMYGYSYAVLPALLFTLVSCLSLRPYFFAGKKRWLAISGILTGITVLFRQDFGAYVFIAECLAIFIFIYKKSEAKNKILSAVKECLFYVLSVFIVIFPAIFYFLSNSALPDLIRDIVIFPVTIYPKVRAIPFPAPSPESAIFYFPIAVFIITAVMLIRDSSADVSFRNDRCLICLILLLGIIFLGYPALRAQIRYLLPSQLMAIILFTYLVYRALQFSRIRHFVACHFFIYGIISVVSIFLFIIPLIAEIRDYRSALRNPALFSLELPRAYGCYDWDENTFYQQEAIKFIQQHTEPDERIFVGNIRHDRIICNDIMFYFLSERHSATRYHELHPGLATTKEIQEKIIDEIKARRVRYVVLWRGNQNVFEPNRSSESSGIFLLDEFIQKDYKLEKVFGDYQILKHI